MQPFTAELIGTAILILLGNGVVANVLLAKTKGFDAGWIVITAGWGIAVFVGAFCSFEVSGAHLNPAVTVAALILGKMSAAKAIEFIIAQTIGALIGAVLVYLFYREHFKVTDDANAKLACFCTGDNIRNHLQSFFCEVVGTFVLILPLLLKADPNFKFSSAISDSTTATPTLGLGAIGLLPVGMLVFGIGLSLGGTTGYAINPIRDFAPRLVHSILPIPGKRDSDWGYAWVPFFGPIVGAALAALLYQMLGA